MARRTRERLYDIKDLRAVLGAPGQENWSDVLKRMQARQFRETAGLSKKAVAQLSDDIRHLEETRAPFTTDYRGLWKELTGAEATEPPAANPANLEDRIPGDVESFDEEEVIHDAENRQASSRVLDVLRRVESKEYKEMAELIESTGEAGWERSR